MNKVLPLRNCLCSLNQYLWNRCDSSLPMLWQSFNHLLAAVAACFALAFALTVTACSQSVSFQEIQKLPVPPADHRLAYGKEALQFGELRLPRTPAKNDERFPVVIVIHGGCWYSEYELSHIANFAGELTQAGVATWSMEYRRIGDAGGAWPGTFQDVAMAADYVRELAKQYPLDLNRVVVTGHSAGGQLALWLAARHRLSRQSELYVADPLKVRGVVALAAISDMQKYGASCGDAASKVISGSLEKASERIRQVSPVELLPLNVPQILIHGAKDRIVPFQMSRDYAMSAKAKGDSVSVIELPEVGHFELISPRHSAWRAVQKAILEMAGMKIQ
jgi:acetyl esterase/lipase